MLSALEVAYPLLAVGLLALFGLAVACLLLGRRLSGRTRLVLARLRWRARRR